LYCPAVIKYALYGSNRERKLKSVPAAALAIFRAPYGLPAISRSREVHQLDPGILLYENVVVTRAAAV
jgi:hypothetical protein